jgi:hypothetical protein
LFPPLDEEEAGRPVSVAVQAVPPTCLFSGIRASVAVYHRVDEPSRPSAIPRRRATCRVLPPSPLAGVFAMKMITSWQDLEAFGIIPLTLESCTLNWRLLCDLDEQGARVVRKCFGFLPDSELGEASNCGPREAPHTASIMLTQEMLIPLVVFALP